MWIFCTFIFIMVVAIAWYALSMIGSAANDVREELTNSDIVMHFRANAFFGNSWVQELIIAEDCVTSCVLRSGKYHKRTIGIDKIAQVNVAHGLIFSEILVINKGGEENVKVTGLAREDASNAKRCIQSLMSEAERLPKAASSSVTVAAGLQECADLYSQGLLSEDEFLAAKKRLLVS